MTTFLLARFFATYAYNVGFQFTVEVRPTCTVLYWTGLDCNVMHCNVMYYAVLHCTALYCIVLYCTVLYCR